MKSLSRRRDGGRSAGSRIDRRQRLSLDVLERRDCPAVLSIGDATVTEGTLASGLARLAVRLSEPSESAVTVSWATADGSATAADRDYRAAAGILVFAPGETAKTIGVSIWADATAEPDETFSVRLSDPMGATVGKGVGTITVRNDDFGSTVPPVVSVSERVDLPEGNTGRAAAVFTLSLSAPSAVPVAVDYATVDGTATFGDFDYVKTSSRVIFAAGETSRTVTVGVIGDSRIEPDETFSLVLLSAENASLGNATSVATIRNDDVRPASLPALSIGSVSGVEGNAGVGVLAFEVRLSAPASGPVTVSYATVDGTAKTSNNDYRAARGTISFAPGETVKTLSIAVPADTRPEQDETFGVTLLSATGAGIDRPRAVALGTILDDDTRPTVSIQDVAIAEGNAGESAATFTVSLDRAWTETVSVSFTTQDGTATVADGDYLASTGTVSFAPGETTATISVTVAGDTKMEGRETFTVTLADPTNATLGRSRGLARLANDDGSAWTILVYMTGENLNRYAFDDINEMEQALVGMPVGVNIVVAWDQPKASMGTSYATGGGSQAAWRTYGRSVLVPDSNKSLIASSFDLTVGERNTGDPATLSDFIRWGAEQAPAQRYLLQMWGHGGGLLGSQFDSESNNDAMQIGEIASALASPGVPAMDIVSYDNCLMGMAEVGYAMANSVKGLFVASEELVNGTGQDYTTAYSALRSPANPLDVTPAQLAASMVASYDAQYQNDRWRNDTFSAAAMSGYAELSATLSQFVTATLPLSTTDRFTLRSAAFSAIAYDDRSFRDLGSFMTQVVNSTSLPSTVRSAADSVRSAISSLVTTKTGDQRGSSGVSVYLPTSNDSYLARYATTAAAFVQATGWNTFVNWLATGSRAVSARAAATPPRQVRPQYAAGMKGFVEAAAPAGGWAGWSPAAAAAAGSSGSADASGSAPRRAVQRAFARMG